MVSVVSTPTQGQFREISGSDDDSPQHICLVHQEHGPFSGLDVLVGHVAGFPRMTEVLKLKLADHPDVDGLQGEGEFAAQGLDVAEGPPGGAEARHGDAVDPRPVQAQGLEGFDADQ